MELHRIRSRVFLAVDYQPFVAQQPAGFVREVQVFKRHAQQFRGLGFKLVFGMNAFPELPGLFREVVWCFRCRHSASYAVGTVSRKLDGPTRSEEHTSEL